MLLRGEHGRLKRRRRGAVAAAEARLRGDPRRLGGRGSLYIGGAAAATAGGTDNAAAELELDRKRPTRPTLLGHAPW